MRHRRARTPHQAPTRVIVLATIAAATLAALTTYGIYTTETSGGQPAGNAPGGGRTAIPPESEGVGPASPGTGAQPQALPTRLPRLRWMDFYGVELPVSPSAGPRHIQGGLAWGFAGTPIGALLAAVNIGVRANAQWGPNIFGPTIRDQVTGLGAGALLAACRVSYQQALRQAGVPAGQPLGPAYVTEQAFRWVAYTPAAAAVDIVSAGPGNDGTTARAVTRIEVVWQRGDWRVIAPPGGDWGNTAAPVTSLTGYISFGNQPLPGRNASVWNPARTRHSRRVHRPLSLASHRWRRSRGARHRRGHRR